MSVYGDMLAAFPELMLPYTAFTMNPKVVGGFEERENVSTIRGNLQFIKSGGIDFEGNTSTETFYPTFWTRANLPENSYIEDDDGTVYRRDKKNSWHRTGAFYAYVMEAVVGVDGRQTEDPDVTFGVTQYD